MGLTEFIDAALAKYNNEKKAALKYAVEEIMTNPSFRKMVPDEEELIRSYVSHAIDHRNSFQRRSWEPYPNQRDQMPADRTPLKPTDERFNPLSDAMPPIPAALVKSAAAGWNPALVDSPARRGLVLRWQETWLGRPLIGGKKFYHTTVEEAAAYLKRLGRGIDGQMKRGYYIKRCVEITRAAGKEIIGEAVDGALSVELEREARALEIRPRLQPELLSPPERKESRRGS